MFVCAYTPRHANFKITWTNFSSLWTFSPVHKVEFCSWCWRCAAWPKTWNGEGRIYSSHNWLLREILTRWPGNSSEQSICLPNVFIHQCPIHLLHALKKSYCPTDVHPWNSTAARYTGVTPFLMLVSLNIWSPIGGAMCWHFPVWSWSRSPLLSSLKWVFHCIWSQM